MPILSPLPFEIDLPALQEALHIKPDGRYAPELERLVRRAEQIGRPKAVYQEYFIESREGDSLVIGGKTFTSRALAMNLEAVEKVYAYVCTAGSELDEANPDSSDMLQKFWWDMTKEAVLGSAIHALDEHIRRTFQMSKTAVMNPGSGDADTWPIEQQRLLFALLGEGPALIGVQLGSSFLMSPIKTVSGLLFATEKDFRTCQVCRRENCRGRRAPFDQALWDAVHSG